MCAPTRTRGTRLRGAFWNAYLALQRRIDLFLSLPMESIDALSLKARLRSIPGGADIDQHAA